jgi:hypothetical protein
MTRLYGDYFLAKDFPRKRMNFGLYAGMGQLFRTNPGNIVCYPGLPALN